MAASAVQATTQEARVSTLCIRGSLSGTGCVRKGGAGARTMPGACGLVLMHELLPAQPAACCAAGRNGPVAAVRRCSVFWCMGFWLRGRRGRRRGADRAAPGPFWCMGFRQRMSRRRDPRAPCRPAARRAGGTAGGPPRAVLSIARTGRSSAPGRSGAPPAGPGPSLAPHRGAASRPIAPPAHRAAPRAAQAIRSPTARRPVRAGTAQDGDRRA